MVRMRWLALAFVCCMATTARAQSTQDTAKAKPAMTKSSTHKARAHKAMTKTAPMAKKSTAPAAGAAMGQLNTDSAKGTAKAATKKPATHRARKSAKAKTKTDTTTKKKG